MKKVKVYSVILFLIIILLFAAYVRIANYSEIFITHIFYVPVILIAYWCRYRVLYLISFIALMLISTDIIAGNYDYLFHDIVRIMLLLFAGIFVAWMKVYIVRFSSFRKYRDILFAVQEPVAIVDGQLNVHIQNRKFSDLFNIPRKGSIIPLLHDLVEAGGLGDAINACLNGVESMYSGVFYIANGDSRLFEIRCYPLPHDKRKNYAVVNFRDITEENEIASKQKRAFDLQRVMIEILELLNKKDYDLSVIDRILAIITGKTGVEAMGLKLRSGAGYSLYSSAGSTALQEYLEGKCDNDCSRDSCFCIRRYCLENREGEDELPAPGEIIWSNDPDEFARLKNMKQCTCMSGFSIKSFAVIPVKSGKEPIGFFILADKRRSFFSSELLEFYAGIAESIGIALDRIEFEENLKQIIEEKELLIREVHHRVKNNMQVITSLISLQASRQSDDSVRSILNECQNRVRTMALVHEKLYSSNNFTSINFGSYINTLVPILMNSYRIEKEMVKVTISAQDIQLGLNTAVPLAQLVNEILSNVFKHAFPAGRSGTVEISLSRDTDRGGNCLSVRDSGVGLACGVTFPSGGNLGFQLIEALVRQIRGRIEFTGTGGVFIGIHF